MQYIATDQPGVVIPVNPDGEPQWAINPTCPQWATYEQWQALPGSVLFPARPSEFHEFINGAWQLGDLNEARRRLQTRNKKACRGHILAKYPVEIQHSMNAGVYGSESLTAYQEFLAACIAEENRVFDLLEAAIDPTIIETPNWPEV